MRPLRLFVVILALATASAWGDNKVIQNAKLTLQTYPPDATITMDEGSNISSRFRARDVIAHEMGDVSWDSNSSDGARLKVKLERPHFKTSAGQVLFDDYASEDKRPGGRILHQFPPMTPDNSLWGALVWVQFHPGLSAVAFLAMVLPLTWIGIRFRKNNQETEKHRIKAAAMEAISARGRQLGDTCVENRTQFGRHTVVDRLGMGGMATVYKALPTDTMDESKKVAIKVILPQFAQDPEFQRRFKREVKVYSELSHPGIVYLEDFGFDPDFMAMEFIEGEPLSKHIPSGGLPLADVLAKFIPILEAVGYAHQQGVVHRDLKPENVMLTPQGHIKVMDFGLARSHNTSNMTQAGEILGTPAYISPEQVEADGPPDARSDQYSLGIMLFEMLTGRTPFVSEQPLALVMKHLNEQPPPLREYRYDLSPELEELIKRMLAKNPRDRFPNLGEVVKALQKCA